MNQDLALRVLGEIMKWDMDRARHEFAWLRLMSRLKYDDYRGFLVGVRFVECLADWLQQFAPEEREIAYNFVRRNLVYIGGTEIQHLIELVYPEIVQRRLLSAVAAHLQMPTYLVWSQPEATTTYERLLRKTLFLGLSDGARMDAFRRANTGIVSNEQVVVALQINQSKWDDLLGKLRQDLQDPSVRFSFVFLLDDFVASGTTLLREKGGIWDGRLPRFWNDIQDVITSHFEDDWVLHVHHYIATYRASDSVKERHEEIRRAKGPNQWFQKVEFSFGTIFPKDLPIDEQYPSDFIRLAEQYYDPTIQTRHTDLGGDSVHLGFGDCALPLILEHNTPNNSVALLWADTEGIKGHHVMRPLFRRRQRHS